MFIVPTHLSPVSWYFGEIFSSHKTAQTKAILSICQVKSFRKLTNRQTSCDFSVLEFRILIPNINFALSLFMLFDNFFSYDGREEEEQVVKVEPHSNGPLFVEIHAFLGYFFVHIIRPSSFATSTHSLFMLSRLNRALSP